MAYVQQDFFEADEAARGKLSEEELFAIRQRLESRLRELDSAPVFPWADTLDAALEENRFERGAKLLGEAGEALWQRFDTVMDRLFATRDTGSSGFKEE